MKSLSAFAALAVLVSSAAAHTIFQELHVDGVSAGHTVGIWAPYYDGPIENIASNDIICNGGINPYRQPVSQIIISVPAGAEGPILAYLAKVPSATQTDVTGLKWFKIYHDGFDKLIKNKGKVSFKIPSCIESGEYLLRVGLIALHAASSYPGAQFYMECAQIKITGGGNVSPAKTVSFPGAYSGTDPGIKLSIYTGVHPYTIPGPEVFTCSADNGPAPSTPPVVTSALPTVTSSVPPVTSPVTGTVPQWGQCGGGSSLSP